MPKGIISRLIVRMNTFIYNRLQWKDGVVLKNENMYAEVKSRWHERKLKIRIYGDNKKEMLAIIRHHIKVHYSIVLYFHG